MLEHRVTTCALFVNKIWCLLINNLALNPVEQRHLGLWLQIVVSSLFLLLKMLVCLLKILGAIERHHPVLTLLRILFLNLYIDRY
jgi:hypothetical protein